VEHETLLQRLRSKLERKGYRSRTVSVRHLCDLRERIERDHVLGLLDEEFYRERLTYLSFKPPDTLPGAESVIVVAVPQPQIRVVFTWHGKPRSAIVPPTYTQASDKIVEDALSHLLGSEGFRFTKAALPLKLLAVQSGLGDYGRNNICYVPGMGSFHRLVAYYSDIPCSAESWQEPQMMQRCRDCEACSRCCPTAAISADRFLIRAERCITFHNERASAFPSWLNPSWHNCLIGCMRCQRACPENLPYLDWIEHKHTFSEQETTCILGSPPSRNLPTQTAKKLEQLGLLEDSSLLGRNLDVLLRRKTSQLTR